MENFDFKDIIVMIWNKKFIILLFILIFIFLGFIYSFYIVVPKYRSTATLVLGQNIKDENINTNFIPNTISGTDLELNKRLINTYTELLQSNMILDKVAENLNISSYEFDKFKKDFNFEVTKETQIINIIIDNPNANLSSSIANEISLVFKEKVIELYNINNVYILDKAQISNEPCNINHQKNILIFSLIGMVIGFLFSMLITILDNKIKSDSELEKITGLMVLCSIPNYNIDKKINKKGRRLK